VKKPGIGAVKAALRREAEPARVKILSSFFKTGPGQYGEGDRFLGVPAPGTRRVLVLARGLDDRGVNALLDSPWHEERALGVQILVDRAGRADAAGLQKVLELYLRRLDAVNNWDLVDVSAHLIVGPAIEGPDGLPTAEGRALLSRLLRSKRLWDRRVAVLATLHFTRKRVFPPLLDAASRLLDDPEDLMHKAVGWMLREAGKRDASVLRRFLRKNASRMPRTALRYAIERLPEAERRRWLAVRKAGR
jgi:3-methyladenine DNA glycosylase AlkD